MYEARVTFSNGKLHIVEASTIDVLKAKCEPFIQSGKVFEIRVVKVEYISLLYSEMGLELME